MFIFFLLNLTRSHKHFMQARPETKGPSYKYSIDYTAQEKCWRTDQQQTCWENCCVVKNILKPI